MKILFTSIGRRVELVQQFRQAANTLDEELSLYGADISDTAPALYFCDHQVKVCRIDDPSYIIQLMGICRAECINLLIPTIDTDLLLLAEAKEQFQAIGTKVLISAVDKIELCRDKRRTAQFFGDCGLQTPKPVDKVYDYHHGFPCFIKPLNGSSSLNAYRVDSKKELEVISSQIMDYIIQPFIEGEEYTVDIFCDFKGKPIYITPRIRYATRAGEVIKTQICDDELAIGECRRIIERFEPVGPITVQFIRQRGTGKDYYLEINPRFGGGAPLSMKAGANSAVAVLRALRGEALEEQCHAAKDGLVYSRYDQSVCINDAMNWTCEAVIFDLDDTLYSEREYVRSGFFAVGQMLEGEGIDDAAARLTSFFEGGIDMPVDVFLKEREVYSDELRNKCIECYRKHKPTIHPYPGIKEMLEKLKRAGIRIGIVTDGRVEGQNAKIDALGLRDFIDEVVITDALGGLHCRKPSDVGFRYIQRLFDIPYNHMLYIGDNAEKDFEAPEHLGMSYWHFDNPDGLHRNGKKCRYIANSPQHLVELLDALFLKRHTE